jgi:hypothetical protein
MGRRSGLLACVALLAVAPPALADGVPGAESGSSSVVTITQPGDPTTQVGTSTGNVTSTTAATPASGSAVPIATATPQVTAEATASPSEATATTDTNSSEPDTDTAATVESPDGQVVLSDVETRSVSRSATEETAQTTNKLEIGEAEIDLREGRRGERRAIKLVVRRGKSKGRARRHGREQITVGEADVGSTSPAAAADEPAVSLEDRVTIDRVKVRSRSRAVGERVSTRLRLDVRNLVVKARDDHVLMTIHHASLTRDGRLRVRISVGPGIANRVVILRAGADVLDPRSYRGSVRNAVKVVRGELAPDTAPGQVLDRLQLRLGAGGVQQGRNRSSGRLDGVVIRIGAAAEGVDARAALPGFVEAVIGHAESASRAITSGIVRTGQGAVIVAGGVADVASAAKTLFIRPPKVRFDKPRVVLRGRELRLMLTCTADVSGVLALRLKGARIPEAKFSCRNERAEIRIKLSAALAAALRAAVPAKLTATLRATTPATVILRVPSKLTLVAD